MEVLYAESEKSKDPYCVYMSDTSEQKACMQQSFSMLGTDHADIPFDKNFKNTTCHLKHHLSTSTFQQPSFMIHPISSMTTGDIIFHLSLPPAPLAPFTTSPISGT